jgi:hypothetical protein
LCDISRDRILGGKKRNLTMWMICTTNFADSSFSLVHFTSKQDLCLLDGIGMIKIEVEKEGMEVREKKNYVVRMKYHQVCADGIFFSSSLMIFQELEIQKKNILDLLLSS